MNSSVAIVILNWNGRHYLQQFLPSVMATNYNNFSVVVADNASTDDSIAFLKENYPQIKLLAFSKNYGFAKGYNEALKLVKADYYVLLNSDVEVTPQWISPIVTLMEEDKKIAACQPKLLMHSNKTLFEYAGAAGGWIDFLGYPFARGRIFDICEEDKHQYNTTTSIFWASGAALFIRATLYHEVNGLDEYFFAHQEEIDLCWRLQLAGYTIKCCPESTVFHVGGGTLPKGNKRKIYLNFRNNLIMLTKNQSWFELWWKLPFRFFLDALSAWKSLFSGQPLYFNAIIKAHWGFFYWLLFKQSASPHPVTKKGTIHGWCTKSVVWAYFVKKETKFSQIVGNNAL